MIRQAWLALYLLGTVVVSATDTETRRIDALLREQEQNKTQKLPPAQNFVLGSTELRMDNPDTTTTAPVVQPVQAHSQAAVTLRQPINENAALSFRNEIGSQKSEAMPFTSNENAYSLDRKEIWALDWTRSNWNGQAYTETQSSGSDLRALSSQQSAYGARTGTKLSAGTELAVEMRQEDNLQSSNGAAERSIYQSQLSQKLGNLPFIFEVTPGVEKETGLDGETFSRSARLNNALLWQANPATRVTLGSGLNSKDYLDATREEAMLYYSQFDTTLKKDVTFSLRSDFQDLTRSSTGLASSQEQKVNIQIGPRFRLPEHFTASLDMHYGYTQQNGSPSSGTSEQALAFSIQGRF
jgi:hypothetical protein